MNIAPLPPCEVFNLQPQSTIPGYGYEFADGTFGPATTQLQPLDALIAEDFSGVNIGLWSRHAHHIPEIQRLVPGAHVFTEQSPYEVRVFSTNSQASAVLGYFWDSGFKSIHNVIYQLLGIPLQWQQYLCQVYRKGDFSTQEYEVLLQLLEGETPQVWNGALEALYQPSGFTSKAQWLLESGRELLVIYLPDRPGGHNQTTGGRNPIPLPPPGEEEALYQPTEQELQAALDTYSQQLDYGHDFAWEQ